MKMVLDVEYMMDFYHPGLLDVDHCLDHPDPGGQMCMCTI